MEKKYKHKKYPSKAERLEAKRKFEELYEEIQAMFDENNKEKQRQIEEAKQKADALDRMNDRMNAWRQIEFENLNTYMMQYKETKDDYIFATMWNSYLKNLTNQYLYEFIIKGLPEMARRLFLTDTKAEELQDVLYPVLMRAIQDWEPNANHRFTKDFAAYYKKAVEYESGNILRKFNSTCNHQVVIQYLDFNSEEEVNILLVNEPKLAGYFKDQYSIEQSVIKWHIEEFVQTYLALEECKLFQMRYEEQQTVYEISNYFKISKMTVYRRIEKIKQRWIEFEQNIY